MRAKAMMRLWFWQQSQQRQQSQHQRQQRHSQGRPQQDAQRQQQQQDPHCQAPNDQIPNDQAQNDQAPSPQRRFRKLRHGQWVWFYIGFQAAFALLFWLPVFYEFQKRLGLRDPEILGIQSIYYIVFVLLEFPTGYFADRFGRRLSLRMAALLLVLCNLLPVLLAELSVQAHALVYAGMLIHFLLISLARSLVSGAASAYLYDRLVEEGRPQDYVLIEGQARAWGLASRVLGWIGVGVLMHWRLSLPYVLTMGSGLVAAVCAWALPGDTQAREPVWQEAQTCQKAQARLGDHAQKQGLSRFFLDLRQIALALRESSALRRAMLQGIAIFVMDRIFLVNLFQPILSSKQLTAAHAGPVLAWVSLHEAIAAGSARSWLLRLTKWVAPSALVLLLTLTMGLSVGAMVFSSSALTLFLFTVYAWAAGLAYPVQREAINRATTDSRLRATIISLESVIDRIVCAAIVWQLGHALAAGALDGFLLSFSTGIVVFVLALGGVPVLFSRLTQRKCRLEH